MEKLASDNIKKMHKSRFWLSETWDRLLMYFSLLEKKDGDEQESSICKWEERIGTVSVRQQNNLPMN